jgi:hypothetical protein
MGGSTPLDVCALPVEKLGEHMFNSAVVHFVTAGQVPIIGGAGAQNAVRSAKVMAHFARLAALLRYSWQSESNVLQLNRNARGGLHDASSPLNPAGLPKHTLRFSR